MRFTIVPDYNGFGGGIDLIFTDHNMPEMNGITFVKKVREVNRKIPILMITCEAEKKFVEKAVMVGIN